MSETEEPDWEVKDGVLIVRKNVDLPPAAVWAILAALKTDRMEQRRRA